MANPSVDNKQKQLSLSQHEALKAKKGKRKPIFDLPGAVFLIFAAPITFFIILMLGYIFYIRRLAAH